MNQKYRAVARAHRVIRSCKNRSQLPMARQYGYLAAKMFDNFETSCTVKRQIDQMISFKKRNFSLGDPVLEGN